MLFASTRQARPATLPRANHDLRTEDPDMKPWLIPLTLAAGLWLAGEAAAHGGTYKGPGDTVPPSGGGAATPAAPTAPTAPATPSTPGAATPAAPTTPQTPGLPATPTNTPQPRRAQTAGPATGPDLTTWEFWWEFNKDPFLNLKAKVFTQQGTTGEGAALVGLGSATTKNTTFAPSPAQIEGTVVPALVQTLEGVDNQDIATGCMVALAKIGVHPEEMTQLFEPRLQDPSQEVKETAAVSLGILQDLASLEDLTNLLLDTPKGRELVGEEQRVDLRTRTFAAYGLGLLAYATEDEDIKAKVADILWETLVSDESALKDIRVACVISLGLTRLAEPQQVVSRLSDYLADESHDFLVRAHCPNAMAKLMRDADAEGPLVAQVVDQFLGLLDDSNTKVEIRQSCVQALGMMTNGRRDPALAERVLRRLMEIADKGKDRQEKNFTSISLGYIGATVGQNDRIRQEITEFLLKGVDGRLGSAYRPWSALALGVMSFKLAEQKEQVSPQIGRSVLAAFEKAKNPSWKSCYAISLGLMKYEDAADPIARSIQKSSNPSFRGYAAVALGLLGATEHKDTITEMVRESKRLPDLLRQASIGLGLMSDRAVVDVLLELMVGEEGRVPPLSVLAASATALGFIGDYRSITPLVNMLKNEELTPLGRAFAAVALGIVGDKEPFPWNSKIGVDLNYRASVDTLVDQESGTGILDIL